MFVNVTCSPGLLAVAWRFGSGILCRDCLGIPSPWNISPLLLIHVGITGLFKDLLGGILSENILERREVQESGLGLGEGFFIWLVCLFGWGFFPCHPYLQERQEEGPRGIQAGQPRFSPWKVVKQVLLETLGTRKCLSIVSIGLEVCMLDQSY